jgi:hypothetical protein
LSQHFEGGESSLKKQKNNIAESGELNLVAIIQTWPDRLKAAGKTQEDAAAESGISEGQLSQYLRGINAPGIHKFQDFENYLRGLGV